MICKWCGSRVASEQEFCQCGRPIAPMVECSDIDNFNFTGDSDNDVVLQKTKSVLITETSDNKNSFNVQISAAEVPGNKFNCTTSTSTATETQRSNAGDVDAEHGIEKNSIISEPIIENSTTKNPSGRHEKARGDSGNIKRSNASSILALAVCCALIVANIVLAIQLHKLSQTAGYQASRILSLQGRVDDLENAQSGEQSAIGHVSQQDYENSIASLETRIAELEDQIANLGGNTAVQQDDATTPIPPNEDTTPEEATTGEIGEQADGSGAEGLEETRPIWDETSIHVEETMYLKMEETSKGVTYLCMYNEKPFKSTLSQYYWQWSEDGTVWENTDIDISSYEMTIPDADTKYQYRCIVVISGTAYGVYPETSENE